MQILHSEGRSLHPLHNTHLEALMTVCPIGMPRCCVIVGEQKEACKWTPATTTSQHTVSRLGHTAALKIVHIVYVSQLCPNLLLTMSVAPT